MRPNYETNITVEGNLGGERKAMGIDASSLAHIVSLLTDLYSDEEMAVIREYSTNALDANIEAGNTDPIQITLPSPLSPYFKVKDEGVGMSPDDIFNIYSQYGASTKRESDDVVGMLGLGCKSGLTYTGQFTLIAVKNGVKTSAVVKRIQDGTGEVEIVDTRATDQPNGVEVVIPAKDATSFHAKARQFFRFWEPGTVLVNGEQPEFIKGRKVTDDTLIVSGLNSNYIVMGNVPYPCNQSFSSILRSWSEQVVAWVPVGAVTFTPSREQLIYNGRTNAVIDDIKQRFDGQLRQAALDDVANASDHTEAWKRASHWRKTINQVYKYKGVEVPDDFNGKGFVYRTNAYRNVVANLSNARWYGSYLENALLVDGFDKQAVSSNDRKKIRGYLESKSLSGYSNVILTDLPFGSPWLDGLPHIKWADIQAFKFPRQPGQTQGGVPQNYDVYDHATKRFVNTTNPTGTHFIYYSPTDERVEIRALAGVFPDSTIVKIGSNRHNKFARDFKNAEGAVEALKRVAKEVLDALSDTDKLLLTARWGDKQTSQRLNPALIDDPDLRAAVEVFRNDAATPSPESQRYSSLQSATRYMADVDTTIKVVKNPLDNYPLMRYNEDDIQHTYEYVNAVFRMRKGN